MSRVLREDLRTGRLLADRPRVRGSVPGGPEVSCRHGGGAALDRHGLWLTESSRLWLLDPGSLDVLRVWRLEDPAQGALGAVAPELIEACVAEIARRAPASATVGSSMVNSSVPL